MHRRFPTNRLFIVLAILILVIFLLLIICTTLFDYLTFKETFAGEFVISPPGEEYQLIIIQQDYLLASKSTIYYQEPVWWTCWFRVKIGTITTDYGCHPFEDNDYLLAREGDTLQIRYFDSVKTEDLDPDTWPTKSFSLPTSYKCYALLIILVISCALISIIYVFTKIWRHIKTKKQ